MSFCSGPSICVFSNSEATCGSLDSQCVWTTQAAIENTTAQRVAVCVLLAAVVLTPILYKIVLAACKRTGAPSHAFSPSERLAYGLRFFAVTLFGWQRLLELSIHGSTTTRHLATSLAVCLSFASYPALALSVGMASRASIQTQLLEVTWRSSDLQLLFGSHIGAFLAVNILVSLAALTYAISSNLVPATDLLSFRVSFMDDTWFLLAVVIWLLILPIVTQLRYPTATATLVALLSTQTNADLSVFHNVLQVIPFFCFGWSHRLDDSQLLRPIARIASCAVWLLLAAVALAVPEALQHISSEASHHHVASMAGYLLVSFLATLCLFSCVSMAESSDRIVVWGTRAMYHYVLLAVWCLIAAARVDDLTRGPEGAVVPITAVVAVAVSLLDASLPVTWVLQPILLPELKALFKTQNRPPAVESHVQLIEEGQEDSAKAPPALKENRMNSGVLRELKSYWRARGRPSQNSLAV